MHKAACGPAKSEKNTLRKKWLTFFLQAFQVAQATKVFRHSVCKIRKKSHFVSMLRTFIFHTGAKTNFLSRNNQEFEFDA